MALPALLSMFMPVPALSQQDDATQREMQRSSLERDQQSDAFALRLQQQQSELLAPPENRAALERLHMDQRGQFEQLLEEQRTAARDAAIGAPAWGPRLDMRLDARPRAQREREAVMDRAARESRAAAP